MQRWSDQTSRRPGDARSRHKSTAVLAAGEFFCVVVSGYNDAQWGNDPCGGAAARHGHPDDVTMWMVGVTEHVQMANDTALLDEVYPAFLKAFGYYKSTCVPRAH